MKGEKCTRFTAYLFTVKDSIDTAGAADSAWFTYFRSAVVLTKTQISVARLKKAGGMPAG
ncbi:hypothetical protein WDV93_13820 [Pantoea ananatis]